MKLETSVKKVLKGNAGKKFKGDVCDFSKDYGIVKTERGYAIVNKYGLVYEDGFKSLYVVDDDTFAFKNYDNTFGTLKVHEEPQYASFESLKSLIKEQTDINKISKIEFSVLKGKLVSYVLYNKKRKKIGTALFTLDYKLLCFVRGYNGGSYFLGKDTICYTDGNRVNITNYEGKIIRSRKFFLPPIVVDYNNKDYILDIKEQEYEFYTVVKLLKNILYLTNGYKVVINKDGFSLVNKKCEILYTSKEYPLSITDSLVKLDKYTYFNANTSKLINVKNEYFDFKTNNNIFVTCDKKYYYLLDSDLNIIYKSLNKIILGVDTIFIDGRLINISDINKLKYNYVLSIDYGDEEYIRVFDSIALAEAYQILINYEYKKIYNDSRKCEALTEKETDEKVLNFIKEL